MSQPPWLSVVMPVHRGGVWLDEALASIPAPDARGSIAVIIRDSTPEEPCEAIIAPHRERLPIDYEYLPDIASWTRKTNMGVAAARSEHVCTLHQDDLWLPARAKVIARLIADHSDAAMLVTGAVIIGSNSEVLGRWSPPLQGAVQCPRQFRDRLLVQNSIAMPAPVWRRDAYLACGGLDEALWYTPDWDLWLKLAAQGPVVFDPEPTAAFRIHGSSLTMTGNRGEMARELAEVLARYSASDRRFAALSRASAKVNMALAEASTGKAAAAFGALASIARLGPFGAVRYLHYSRIAERVIPRLRMRLKRAI
ncbi:glycosyltransferase family 2 protein [Qipengyuania sp. ASV99]|uniref:glycosyltransferase family 2 protein n=1 Tax=Qipengyuania sp. ASV99 TaxID=3399681 RepID=UPI003A4C754C